MLLDEFNKADVATAASVTSVWAQIPAWVDAVVAARPYASVDSLAARARALTSHWTRADLDAALAHHPRIGQRVTGAGAEAEASRTEQASMADAESSVTAAMAAGNAAYEERFGRVFLIRAAGRTPEEMLGELRRRLQNDDEAEAIEASGQLAEIALLRLRGAISEAAISDGAISDRQG